MEATWKPHEKHGRLTEQSDLPDSVFAFPKERKEPLTDASHVRNAIARLDQVTGVTKDARELAFAVTYKKAAEHSTASSSPITSVSRRSASDVTRSTTPEKASNSRPGRRCGLRAQKCEDALASRDDLEAAAHRHANSRPSRQLLAKRPSARQLCERACGNNRRAFELNALRTVTADRSKENDRRPAATTSRARWNSRHLLSSVVRDRSAVEPFHRSTLEPHEKARAPHRTERCPTASLPS